MAEPEDKKPFDASDPQAVGKRKKESEVAGAMRMEGFRVMMGSVQGRSAMWWMLTITHPFQTSCTEFNAKVYFNEGERNIGLQLIAMLHQQFPDEYLRMMKENSKS